MGGEGRGRKGRGGEGRGGEGRGGSDKQSQIMVYIYIYMYNSTSIGVTMVERSTYIYEVCGCTTLYIDCRLLITVGLEILIVMKFSQYLWSGSISENKIREI